jgi:hypothetical protein
MVNRIENLIYTVIIFIITVLASGCDKLVVSDPGFLEGKISIGPLCPVEHDPPDSTCLPTAETYKAYPVGIWTSKGNTLITIINPALDGSFKTELEPGIYTIRLEKNLYNIGSSNLPVEVSIISGKETLLDINIDTGIR